MLKHNYGEAYIRRYKKGDVCDSYITAVRLAAACMSRESKGKHAYVMVRRGFPNVVLEVGFTRKDLVERLTISGFRDLKETLRWFRVDQPEDEDAK